MRLAVAIRSHFRDEQTGKEYWFMKVTIDRDGCIQCGACEQACGDVFVLDGGEPAAVVEAHRKEGPAEGEIPDNLVDCAREAADSCPVQVITVG